LELDLSKCTFGTLNNLENYFNFGLIHAKFGGNLGLIYSEFGGLFILLEDLHQNVLIFSKKVAT